MDKDEGRVDGGDLLTVAEAAELLGVSSSTLRNWDKAGKLKAKRHPMNRYRLYSKQALIAVRESIVGYDSNAGKLEEKGQ